MQKIISNETGNGTNTIVATTVLNGPASLLIIQATTIASLTLDWSLNGTTWVSWPLTDATVTASGFYPMTQPVLQGQGLQIRITADKDAVALTVFVA